MTIHDAMVGDLVRHKPTNTALKVVKKGRPYGTPTLEFENGWVLEHFDDDAEFADFEIQLEGYSGKGLE